MKFKFVGVFLAVIFMSIFLVASVSALGISPARTTLDFKEGLEKTVNFEVFNSEGKDMRLVLSVRGELKDYITIPVTEVFVSASESSKSLSYDINLPESLEPGPHTGEVFVMEMPLEDETGDSQILATLAVVMQLYVHVPYPGKYAHSKMAIYDANQGEDVTFVFPVVSAGEFDLTSVRANVDIYNKLSEKVGSFNTQSILVPSGEKKDLVYHWKADVPIGDYRAVASLIYDGGTLNLEGTFRVGSEELVLQEIGVKSFSLGEIAKLEMLVENKWSKPILGAHIATKIRNSGGDLVSSFESASYDIDALTKKVFVSYWDTAGVKVGTYEGEVSINYDDKSSKKSLEFQVAENDLTIIGLGYVISAGGGDGVDTLVVVLIIVIVVLVMINLLWFLILRKKLKK